MKVAVSQVVFGIAVACAKESVIVEEVPQDVDVVQDVALDEIDQSLRGTSRRLFPIVESRRPEQFPDLSELGLLGSGDGRLESLFKIPMSLVSRFSGGGAEAASGDAVEEKPKRQLAVAAAALLPVKGAVKAVETVRSIVPLDEGRFRLKSAVQGAKSIDRLPHIKFADMVLGVDETRELKEEEFHLHHHLSAGPGLEPPVHSLVTNPNTDIKIVPSALGPNPNVGNAKGHHLHKVFRRLNEAGDVQSNTPVKEINKIATKLVEDYDVDTLYEVAQELADVALRMRMRM